MIWYPTVDPWRAAACVVVIGATAQVLSRHYLRQFPWRTHLYARQELEQKVRQRLIKAATPWPYDPMNTAISTPGRSGTGAVLTWALLLGWWVFHVDVALGWRLTGGCVALFCGLVRLGYMRGCLPPISLWGRLWTRRLIIPSYDSMLLAPLVIGVVGVAAVLLNRQGGLAGSMADALAATVAVLLAVKMPPNRRRWLLLSEHRLVRPRTPSGGRPA